MPADPFQKYCHMGGEWRDDEEHCILLKWKKQKNSMKKQLEKKTQEKSTVTQTPVLNNVKYCKTCRNNRKNCNLIEFLAKDLTFAKLLEK